MRRRSKLSLVSGRALPGLGSVTFPPPAHSKKPLKRHWRCPRGKLPSSSLFLLAPFTFLNTCMHRVLGDPTGFFCRSVSGHSCLSVAEVPCMLQSECIGDGVWSGTTCCLCRSVSSWRHMRAATQSGIQGGQRRPEAQGVLVVALRRDLAELELRKPARCGRVFHASAPVPCSGTWCCSNVLLPVPVPWSSCWLCCNASATCAAPAAGGHAAPHVVGGSGSADRIHECVLDLASTHFLFTIPMDAPAAFTSPTKSMQVRPPPLWCALV